MTLVSPGSPEHVSGYRISSGFFRTLGVSLAVGSSFSPNEDRFGGIALKRDSFAAMPAAVISNRLWQERFQGNPAVVGKTITLNGAGYTIVGVLPAAFRFEDQPVDVFTPIGQADPLFPNDRTIHDMLCIARLGHEVSIGQAQAEMNTLQEHIDELNPTTEKGLETSIIPLKQSLIGDVRGTLLLLLGAVGFVLLIACANVANLLLARSAARRREFAVRRALGTSRMQIIWQLITESVLLSFGGGVLGLAIAKFG
jgi:putative ABC transport system permease protein